MNNDIKNTVQTLEKIYTLSKPVITSIHGKKLNTIENILGILIAERILGNLNAVRILLTATETDYDIEPAIGLILRNNLSNCKIIFKHAELLDEESKLPAFYKSVFGENIQRTINKLRKSHTKEELQPYLDNIVNGYSFILKSTGIDLNTIEQERIYTDLNLPMHYNSLGNLFDAYSKYEHFGLNTLLLQSNSDGEKLERINIAIHYSLQGVMLCLAMLGIKHDPLIALNQELTDKVRKTNPRED